MDHVGDVLFWIWIRGKCGKPRPAWMFSSAAGSGKYRKDLPAAAWAAAVAFQLQATTSTDSALSSSSAKRRGPTG